MSIVFIFFGIAFLLICFGYIKFQNPLSGCLISSILLFAMCSYFGGWIIFEKCSLNFLQIICAVLTIMTFVRVFAFSSIVYSLLFDFIYKLCIEVLGYSFSHIDYTVASIVILLSALRYISNVNAGILHISLISIVVGLIIGHMSFESIGYFYFDISFMYSCICAFLSVVVISYSFQKKFLGGYCFVEKMYGCSFGFSVTFNVFQSNS